MLIPVLCVKFHPNVSENEHFTIFFFTISLLGFNAELVLTFKKKGKSIYPINSTETASAKFQKVLFSWAPKLEDCFCVLTPKGLNFLLHVLVLVAIFSAE